MWGINNGLLVDPYFCKGRIYKQICTTVVKILTGVDNWRGKVLDLRLL